MGAGTAGAASTASGASGASGSGTRSGDAAPWPLCLGVVAPLSGDAAPPEASLPVDAEGFDAAVARVAPRLTLRVPGAAGADELDVELGFAAWSDFAPAGVAAQVPRLAALVALRAQAEALEPAGQDALLDEAAAALPPPWAEALRRALAVGGERGGPPPAGAATSEPGRPEGSLDALFEMVDTGEPARERTDRGAVDRAVGALVASVRRSGRRAGGPRAAALEVLDALLSAQLGAVFREPAFRRLEAAWSGLRFLVRRTDFRAPVALRLRSADTEGAAAAVRALGEDAEPDAVLVDAELDASARDLARARALAEAAGEAGAPVLVGVAPAFFGLDDWDGLSRSRSPAALFDGDAHAGWRSLREDESARSLVLVANRLVLRGPYGPDGERARGVAYAESPDGALLGTAVWGVGVLLVRAFARDGACLRMAGSRHGLLPDLPLVPGRDGRARPLEGGFGGERREDLERVGLCALQHYQRDVALAGALHSFRRPARHASPEDRADAAQQVTLAYQIFAGRLARFLGRSLPGWVGAAGPEELARRLREEVVRFVSQPAHPCPPDHVGVAVRPDPEAPGLADVTLRVQPEARVGGRPLDVMLRFGVRL